MLRMGLNAIRALERAIRLKADIEQTQPALDVSSANNVSACPVEFVGIKPLLPQGGVPLTGALEALYEVILQEGYRS